MAWAWGLLSPQMVQHLMSLFRQDLQAHKEGKLDLDMPEELASLGCDGRFPNNCARDLESKLPRTKMPKPFAFKCPLKHTVLGFMHFDLHMILPHELFSAIYHCYPKAWNNFIYPGAETCKKFWRQVQGGMHFLSHPVKDRLNFRTMCIPISIHGDGTPCMGIGKSWGKQMDIWSWTSMLCTGPTILRNFLIFCVHQCLECSRAGHRTLDEAFAVMAWSFEALYNGEWPRFHWKTGEVLTYALAGKPLAGGYFATVWALVNDLDHNRAAMDLQNASSSNCCTLCPANITDKPWWDFGARAKWRAFCYTPASWAAAGWNKCKLFDIPGVSVLSLYPDWMHTKHLGCDKVMLGSVLWLLVKWLIPGSCDEERLNILWNLVLRIYQVRNTENRFGTLRLSMFTSGKAGPKLKGKAAEIKDFVPVLHIVWQQYSDCNLDLHKKIELLLRMSYHMDDIVDAHSADFALPEDQSEDLATAARVHFTTFNSLKKHFEEEDYPIFQLTSKAHYVFHCCLLAHCLNPRMCWCYTGEDFMGKMRALATSCAKGALPWKVPLKMILKYLVALDLTLTDPEQWFKRRRV